MASICSRYLEWCRLGGAGGAMAPPDFGRSFKPISTRGTDYVHLKNTTGTPGFSDLPTALSLKPVWISAKKHLLSDIIVLLFTFICCWYRFLSYIQVLF